MRYSSFFLSVCLIVAIHSANAQTQAPDWVVLDLSTEGLSSGMAGIGNDGTMAWIELNAGMAQVFRRSPDGQAAILVENPGGWADSGGVRGTTPINAVGDVISVNRDAVTRSFDVYANTDLAYVDGGGGPLVSDNRRLYEPVWSGNGVGDLAVYDIATLTRTIYAHSATFSNVTPVAIAQGDTLVMNNQPVGSGINEVHLWNNGIMTPLAVAGLPVGYSADLGAFAADARGSKIAYMYQALQGPGENLRVLVTEDLTTNDSASILLPEDPEILWDIAIDAQGRVIYQSRIFDPNRFQNGGMVIKLFVFDGVSTTEIASELFPDTIPRINDDGQIVYSRFPDSCGLVNLDTPTCKADVFYYDLDTNEETQVTDVPDGTFVWSAWINNSADIVFMYAGKVRISGSNDSDASFSVGAALIDIVAPSQPANLTAGAVSQSQINLTWTASADVVGLDFYEVFRDSVRIAATAGTSLQDTGLASNTTYTYEVVATDLAGNRSTPSDPATASTLEPAPPPSSGGGGGAFGMWTLIGLFIGCWSLARRSNWTCQN